MYTRELKTENTRDSVHGLIIHYHKVKVMNMSINRQVDQKNIKHTHYGLGLGHKKTGFSDIYDDMDEP